MGKVGYGPGPSPGRSRGCLGARGSSGRGGLAHLQAECTEQGSREHRGTQRRESLGDTSSPPLRAQGQYGERGGHVGERGEPHTLGGSPYLGAGSCSRTFCSAALFSLTGPLSLDGSHGVAQWVGHGRERNFLSFSLPPNRLPMRGLYSLFKVNAFIP